MRNRDDFSERTKRTVALRANHRCSFPGCDQITSGPSAESTGKKTMIGKAAHIHGASSGPGSRRYLASMSPEERKHIDNAIWLCSTHADMIDQDEVTFTADELRAMKDEHERRITALLHKSRNTGTKDIDFISVGPSVTFTGIINFINPPEWEISLYNFFEGTAFDLMSFAENFEKTPLSDRYILVNVLGDGRLIEAPPSIQLDNSGNYRLRCLVSPPTDRIPATEIPKSWALTEQHDLSASTGRWHEVSGINALPQQVKTCLSHQRGESPLHPTFGSRFAEYFKELSGSPWLERYLKLETIRQAAIPYCDPFTNEQYTPMLCVERVFDIKILAKTPTNRWLPIRVDLQIKGLGRWEHDLSVCIP